MAIFWREAEATDFNSKKIEIPIYQCSLFIVMTLFPIYGAVILLATILPRRVFQKLGGLLKWRRNQGIPMSDEPLPYRIEHSERDPLIAKW